MVVTGQFHALTALLLEKESSLYVCSIASGKGYGSVSL